MGSSEKKMRSPQASLSSWSTRWPVVAGGRRRQRRVGEAEKGEASGPVVPGEASHGRRREGEADGGGSALPVDGAAAGGALSGEPRTERPVRT